MEKEAFWTESLDLDEKSPVLDLAKSTPSQPDDLRAAEARGAAAERGRLLALIAIRRQGEDVQAVLDGLEAALGDPDTLPLFSYGDLQNAFYAGALDGQQFPRADSTFLDQAADAYCKLVQERRREAGR